ncbi:MAG: archaemetzincin [Pirellula sp.]
MYQSLSKQSDRLTPIPRTISSVASCLLMAVGACTACNWLCSQEPRGDAQRSVPSVESVKQTEYATVTFDEESDFLRKGNPKPGDWLARFNEPGQSLESYKSRDARKLISNRRKAIVLQPLGNFTSEQKKVLDALEEYAEAYFQRPARIAPMIPLPKPSTNKIGRVLSDQERSGTSSRQYDASKIIDTILLKKIPDDAVIYLGVTMEDLFVTDLNFVFGLGSFENRCGVYSLVRYFPEFWGEESTQGSRLLALRRSFKVLNHESSHVLGMRHCIYYECTMNGSNSLSETDRAPIHECPICHRKLQWAIAFDPEKRFEAMKKCYLKYDMAEEAAWIDSRARNWKVDRR